ncbi:bifunctional nuclease family protein [Fervidicoccus fontis]|uniref:Bifunctional nuclease family protein n=1 Tax=Fervidicoccus fontis TaxID=683846 RepID=A0A843AAX9_9CREN|nr:DUF151 domain-containing protein [Fervidicoccus fontis]MBE9391194.1 bifunctional nuclease family protein [Fervidicoccus fontis]
MNETTQKNGKLLKAVEMDAYIASKDPLIPVILLILENGDEFELYNVPLEIARFVINGSSILNGNEKKERIDIFSFIAMHEDILNLIKDDLEKVVIDEYDPTTMLYTAKVYFRKGKTMLVRRFIPSHAIFLAMIAGKDVYVSERILNIQKN